MTAKIDGTAGLLQQYDYQVSTTGFSYTFAAGTTVLVMNPAGTLATGTITMPAAPADGMTISFSSTQIITALTVSANTGQSIVGQPTTMNAGGAATFVYRLSNTTWYAQSNTASIALSTGVPVLNVYTSSGTWTKPTTVKAIKVTVVGGGNSGTNGGTSTGGGGGAGGASINIYPAPSLPGPQPYTVGATGASSSFGVAPATVISATGGASATGTSGGAGGTGSGGQLNISGGSGNGGMSTPTPAVSISGGMGGSSFFGAGGGGKPSGGPNGGNYGGGGGGGSNQTPSPAGTGASGVVIVEEFY